MKYKLLSLVMFLCIGAGVLQIGWLIFGMIASAGSHPLPTSSSGTTTVQNLGDSQKYAANVLPLLLVIVLLGLGILAWRARSRLKLKGQ